MNGLITILLIHAALTWFLTGIIWFAQVVHFRLYTKIKEGFNDYEKSYMKKSGYFLGPLMLLEFITAVILFGWAMTDTFAHLTSINLSLIILTWISTLLFQINQHQKLSIRFSWKWYRSLVYSNWVRTTLWTVRTFLVIWMIIAY